MIVSEKKYNIRQFVILSCRYQVNQLYFRFSTALKSTGDLLYILKIKNISYCFKYLRRKTRTDMFIPYQIWDFFSFVTIRVPPPFMMKYFHYKLCNLVESNLIALCFSSVLPAAVCLSITVNEFYNSTIHVQCMCLVI